MKESVQTKRSPVGDTKPTNEQNVEGGGLNKMRRLIPVTQWSQYHMWPPIGGLRHLIFHADENGFAGCLRRVGRRILIDEAAFFLWVDRQS